jgi:hypothetical protein
MLVSSAKAQVNININIGSQPAWGPTGYQKADYYYLPDVDSYYNVSTHEFIYLNNGRWVFAQGLPPQYRNYDLYSGYKVVVNRPRPYLNYNEDHAKYARYRGWAGRQENIRDHGNPHGMPPGQYKKYYNDNIPPGQAKKRDRGGDDRNDEGDKGHGDHGHGNHGHGHDD